MDSCKPLLVKGGIYTRKQLPGQEYNNATPEMDE